MSDSQTHHPPSEPPQNDAVSIPIEIISEHEMALIDAAFSAVSKLKQNSVRSISLLSKRKLTGCSTQNDVVGDIEEGGRRKKKIVNGSFLYRFRRRRGLSVTDLTSTEWCEKQMEFVLHLGRPEKTNAMKAGSARHAALEEEVIKRVKVEVKSKEDIWALMLINFIVGANQLVFDGLTRELPVIGFTEGIWITGVIDEIRMPLTETDKVATLVDTKTRVRATLPSEPQRRNGRFQLMCYKHLWDTLAAGKFPYGQFFDFFSLNPNSELSTDIKNSTAKTGFPAETLSDVVIYYKNACCMLPQSNSQLLLRYENQVDQTLIGEDQFEHDSDWFETQIKTCLEFWMGDRSPHYAQKEERWKCNFCKFESVCERASNDEAKIDS
ncbi:hypothetical protein Leryth_016304 [Lithospermum erythrorhizon]|nr:hypothetical protein Leryth_016304 [Lithospermum erythrorhizon]